MADLLTPTALPKLRTFAHDLDVARATQGHTVADQSVSQTVSTPVVTQTVAATSPVAKAATIPTRLSAPTPLPVPPEAAALPTTPHQPVLPTQNGPIKLTASSDRDASYAATIITDNKHKRFNVSSEISQSVSSWWNDTLKGFENRKKPKYTVPTVDRRKGVIERATSTTARSTTHDHHEIVARLRARQNGELPPAPTVVRPTPTKKPEPVAIPSVSSIPQNLPTTASLPEFMTAAPTPKIIVPTVEIPEPTPIAARIEPIIPNYPAPEVVVPDTDVISLESEIYSAVLEEEKAIPKEETAPALPPVVNNPTPILPTPYAFPKITPVVPIPTVTPARAQSLVMPEVIPEVLLSDVPLSIPRASSATQSALAARRETLTAVAASGAAARPRRRFSLRQLIAEPLFLLGAVFILSASGLAYIFLDASPTTPAVSEVVPVTPVSNLPNMPSLPAGNASSPFIRLTSHSKTALYTAIGTAKNETDTLTLVTPLHSETGILLSRTEILELINRRLVADFIAAIADLQLGYYRGSPALIMRITDDNVARGGMFAWERTLSSDLSPWFGAPVAGNTTRGPEYTDSISSDTDIRMLRNEAGAIVIVYGIKNGVLIITDSESSFLNLATTYAPAW